MSSGQESDADKIRRLEKELSSSKIQRIEENEAWKAEETDWNTEHKKWKAKETEWNTEHKKLLLEQEKLRGQIDELRSSSSRPPSSTGASVGAHPGFTLRQHY